MFIYSVDNVDDTPGGSYYCTSKAEAFKLARENAKGGNPCQVDRCTVAKGMRLPALIAACLNNVGWAEGDNVVLRYFDTDGEESEDERAERAAHRQLVAVPITPELLAASEARGKELNRKRGGRN